MAMRVSEVEPARYESMVPVLSEADEDDDRIRAELVAPGRVTYAAHVGDDLVAAATMRWDPDESELVYLVTPPRWRRQGHGLAIVAWLLTEAARRGTASVIVGTASSSVENIVFYQRCGFRMDHVRPDYFAYVTPPVVEHGIVMRDMVVFRHQLR